MSSVTRTISLRPFACFDKKTGTGLDLYNTLEEVRNDATLCASEASKHITYENLEKISEYDGLKPAEAGRQIGIKLPPGESVTGRSRFEKMVQEYTVTQLRSWHERTKTRNNKNSQYVSAGYRRTNNSNKPAYLKPRLALSATDKRYHTIHKDGYTIELEMVVNKRWVTFTFKTPVRFTEPGVRVIAPTISIDDKNRVMFNWHIELPVERSMFSDKYMVGVDVGITNHTTAVVRNIETGKVVEASFMNRRVHSLENKINRAKTQIAVLKKRGRDEEAASHRKALSNRRKELAILIGQEVADLSWRYGNALVAIEDLSHITNTMKHGRWVRGLIVKRITEMVESNGGRVMTVNPAYTSRKCHQCGTMLDMSDYHIPTCSVCRVGWDRDENAAANIAGKLQDKHKKACQTRKRHASKKRRKNSKGLLRPLKHPVKKMSPTPKAPQNKPKPNNSHCVHHKHAVIKTREGGVFPVLCATGWSLRDRNVRVPAVASTLSSGCSDNKPHDYPTDNHRLNDLCLH
jgi:IS605 family transposase